MKIKIIVMNIIYAILGVLCIVMLFTKPYIDFNIGYSIKGDMMYSLVKDISSDIKEKDCEKICGEKGIQLNINLLITREQAFGCAFADDSYVYAKENILADNIDKIANDLEEPINQLVEGAVKAISASIIEEQIKDQIKNTLGAGTDAAKAMADAGISDEYLSEQTDKIFAALTGEDAKVDTVVDAIADSVDDMMSKLAAENPEFAGKELSEQDKEDLKATLNSTLDELGLVDADGNITDTDEMISALLGSLLGGEEGASSLLAHRVGEDPAEENAIAEKLKEILYSKLDEASDMIGLIFKIACFVLLFMLAAWAIFVVVAIVKSLFKNPGIPFGVVFWINFIVQFILGIVLAFLPGLLIKFGGSIPMIGGMIAQYSSGLSLSLMTCAFIPSIISLCILISKILYKHWVKKYKREAL